MLFRAASGSNKYFVLIVLHSAASLLDLYL
jgi:hypothetical protein